MSDKLAKLYSIRFSKKEVADKNKIWEVLCRDFFEKYISEKDTVLDVACGYGEFINNVTAGKKIAVDLNPNSKDCLQNDITFINSDVTNIGSLFFDDIDAVFVSNFLEHLPSKKAVETFIEDVFSMLRPGGRFLILGPNLRYLPGKYWDFFDHHVGLTHISLCEVLMLKGFRIKSCFSRFLPYTTKSLLPKHPLLIKLYLRMSFVWPLLGKQFFVVAEKPEPDNIVNNVVGSERR